VPAWWNINLINISLIFITTMAGSIKNLIIMTMINWPSFKTHSHKTPSQEDNKPTKVLQTFHQSRIKSFDAPCEGQNHVLDLDRSTLPPTVTPATIFARTPAFCRQYDPLDVDSKFGLCVYDDGRAPVLKGDSCFDLEPETLGQFLRLIDKKATDQGWNDASSTQQIGIFNITHNGDPTTISITKEHHYIEMAALRAQCKRFMIPENSQHRASQNNQMMQECIWESLTLRAQQRIAQYEDEYTLNGLLCGPLLLKIIICTVTENSRTTILTIKSRLDHIDDYAAEINGNVDMITEFFTEHLEQLKLYGAILDDPMDILFKGLRAVPCEEFHRYISNKENRYYGGSLTLTPKELVLMAQQKYMILKAKGATSTTQAPETPGDEVIGQTKMPQSSHRS